MRVIAGTAKGHPLRAPSGDGTRPTADRVREALFSSLQAMVGDAVVLDLYAGSGALGIEALSRGAGRATFVERDRRAASTIRDNLRSTGLGAGTEVVVRDVRTALSGLAGESRRFDLVLLDPPYAVDPGELAAVLAAVSEVLTDGGLVRLEQAARAPDATWPETLLVGRTRRYGDTRIVEATAHTADETAGETS